MNCKKMVALMLFVMLVTLICFTAFADTSSVAIGKTKYKTYYNISSAPTYQLKIVGHPYQKMTVKFSYWDTNVEKKLIEQYKTWDKVPDKKKNTCWKQSNTKSVSFPVSAQRSYIINISQGKDYKFVSKTRNPKVRLSFTASKTDKTMVGHNDPIKVTYP